MDSGLWFTWYDLPEQGRDDYLPWLHQTYIPAMLKRKGFLWGAHYASVKESFPPHVRHTDDKLVPAGNDYILIFGAESPTTFFQGEYTNDAPAKLHAGASETTIKMLAMRKGERTNIMVEAGRDLGAAAADYKDGMQLGPFIQLGTYNCDWQKEQEMQAWYSQVRMPAITETPGGAIRVRKLVSAAGWAKHGIMYEFLSLQAKKDYFAVHKDRPDMKPWTDWVAKSLIHAPGSATIANRIWPPVTS